MHGVVVEDQFVEIMIGLPGKEARAEVLELVGRVRQRPYAYPHTRKGDAEEIHEAFGDFCWVRYGIRDGAVQLHDVGWLN